MRIKTSELEGLALDWAVADALGWMYESEHAIELIDDPAMIVVHWLEGWDYEYETEEFRPSTDWSQGGPLIEAMVVDIENDGEWSAYCFSIEDDQAATMAGNTPLIATCRAIVAAKLGDEVEVPDELL